MPQRNQEINLVLSQIVDAFLLLFAFWIAYVSRVAGTDNLFDGDIPKFEDFRWVIWLIMPAGPIILESQGYYKPAFQKSWKELFKQILKSLFLLGLLISLVVTIFKLYFPSRVVLTFFIPTATIILVIEDRLKAMYLRRQMRSEGRREPVLLVGRSDDMHEIISSLTNELRAQMTIVDCLDIEHQSIEEIVEVMREHAVSRVILSASESHLKKIEEAISACEVEGVEVWLATDFIRTTIAKPSFDVLANRPMLVFRSTPETCWSLLVKRVIDLIVSAIGIILLSPLLLVVAILVRCTSRGKAIFAQNRSGRHGKPFRMYKFRTMREDAEQLHEVVLAQNEMSGPVFKLDHDPRLTPIGASLRRWSIDELPQLFNIFLGDMSLVGPRPLPTYEVEKFEYAAQRRRLSVPPGLTCLWQINGRNEIRDFNDWVKLDLWYIDHWSLWLDLKILIKTVPVVLLGKGAK